MNEWESEIHVRELRETLQDHVLEIGSRLKNPPSALLIDTVFAWELQHQLHLFYALGLTDIAQTLAALELATIPGTAGRELLAALLELQQEPDSFVASVERGDIYTNREAWLRERTSAVGWLGAGLVDRGKFFLRKNLKPLEYNIRHQSYE